jgi:hypothetical protein
LITSAGNLKDFDEVVSINNVKPFIQDGEDQQIHVF